MTRSNPYKKKPRSAKKTVLIFGEGLGEEIFLKYLKSLYAQNTGVEAKISRGKGGSADGIVIDAGNLPGAYAQRMAVLDCDKSKIEMNKARKEAATREILLLENKPCLEAVLLAILSNGKVIYSKGSATCKKEFESKYISKKKRGELKEYAKLFPKSLLDKQRIKVTELDKMISFIQGIA